MYKNNLYVPIITPLCENSMISHDSVGRLLDTLRPYAEGVICCLTSGEGWLLSATQWRDMVVSVLAHAGSLKVVCGIERPDTKEVLNYAMVAASLGIETIIITTPFGTKITQNKMMQHYLEIHNNFPGEIWIYHEEPLSSNLLERNTLIDIATLPRIVGLKDSTENDELWQMQDILTNLNVKLFRGMESQLMSGTDFASNIVSLSNLEPQLCHKASYNKNSSNLLNTLGEKCEKYCLSHENWFAYIKKELMRRGIISTDLLVHNMGVEGDDVKSKTTFSV